MRSLLALLVVAIVNLVTGCTSPPPAPAALHELAPFAADPGLPRALALAAPDWKLRYSAELADGALQLAYCCRSASIAERALPEIDVAGRWTLAFAHASSECTTAVIALVVSERADERAGSPIARVPLDADLAGTARGTFTVTPGDLPVRLVLHAEGGLRCCGSTTVQAITLAPAASAGGDARVRSALRGVGQELDDPRGEIVVGVRRR